MKAVILAGGEGKRLRPLTDNTPKPMTPLFSKPVLAYILDMLERNGFDETVVTLRFLPEVITHYFGQIHGKMRLRYVTEQTPRGTAGAVKDAAADFTDPFVVLSGDGVFDFDINGILDFHKAAKSECTVVCREVRDPGEYGLINKGDDNRILSFNEKPGWNRVDGNLANTGVYVLEPHILDLIPTEGSVDFAADVFPQLLQANAAFYAYKETGFWCDIGSPEAYKACHRAVFDGETDIELPRVHKDVYAQAAMPGGSYTVIPPVWFGKNISIGDQAVIGPYTAVGDGCSIGSGATVRKSVLQSRVYCGENALISDSVLCDGVTAKRGSRIFENAVLGAGTVVGENATVGSGVTVSSGKVIDKNALVSENITEGGSAGHTIENGCISGAAFTELSVSAAASLGAAFGSAKTGKYLATGFDGKNSSRSVLSAITGGVVSAGANVWSMGRSFLSEFVYMLTYSGMNAGLYVSTDDGIVSIRLFGEHGLAPDRKTERDCDYRFRRSDFSPCGSEYCGSVRDMSYLLPMYRRRLAQAKNEYYGGRNFFIRCENSDIQDLCRDFFGRHCTESEGLPLFTIGRDGTSLSLTDEENEHASYENLLTLCCYDSFLQGCDVAVPYDAPKVINRLAAENGCHVIRYCDEDDAENPETAHLISECAWARDALFMTVKLLDMSLRLGTDLHGLLKKLPVFFVYEKSVSVAEDGAFTGEILKRFREENGDRQGIGVGVASEKGDVLLSAAGKGQRIRILAEAADEETAAELCGEIEDRIHSILSSLS